MKHIISLGAGVQSSTMALMAAAGEITPMPDCAIFADTKAEPSAVYKWLDFLEKQLPFPVHRVCKGDLGALVGVKPNGKYGYMPMPAFVAGDDGKAALLNRSCTRDFKIYPIQKKVRELVGLTRKRSPKEPVVTQWIGISADEAQRAKPSRDAWQKHRWPLLELRMTRLHCIEWLGAHGFQAPAKSSCTFCPFHDDALWAEIKKVPAEWEDACRMDERIRDIRPGSLRGDQKIYLHRSLKPLRQVEFKPTEPDLFDEKGFAVECEGMCGV